MRDLMATKMAELKFEAPLARFEEAEDWVAGGGGGGTTAAAAVADRNDSSTPSADDNNCFLQQQHAAAANNNYNNNNVLSAQQQQQNNATAAAVASLLAAATAEQQPKQQSVGAGGGDASAAAAAAAMAAAVCDAAAAAAAAAAAGGGGGGGSGPSSLVGEEPASFGDAFSGSLEDLVHTFDEKLTRCFCDYEQSVEALAPVQVRSQDDIMSECQMWWTITGNFGNILPIDWSKSCARKMQLGSLNLTDPKECGLSPGDEELPELSSEDEAASADLDMHALILSGLGGGGGRGGGRGGLLEEEMEEEEPIKTAEEVIREIDDLLQESPPPPTQDERPAPALASPLYEDKLRGLSASRLNELYLELELLIRDFSETLIAELALRDELEYEKELKNTFISLLLAVQNRRRQHHVERKRRGGGSSSSSSQRGHHAPPNGLLDPKYLTTVIPYHLGSGPPDNQALQVLIKILKAINEDSPTVPTLLTDYILKVLCPT